MGISGKNKMVSIVLPVYNGEEYIAQSIESILRQTYRKIELIIVNDCSTDKTKDIIKDYAKQDSRIKIVENSINLKLPKSLTAGFSVAQGDYYTWTSDDNIYKEDAIEIMVDTLEKNPEYSMTYANYTMIDSHGYELGVVKLQDANRLIMGNVIGACFLYTREVAVRVGEYDANLFLAEDYDYWIRILRMGKIYHIEDTLYYYRKHDKSLTDTRKKEIKLQTYRALEKNFLFLYSSVKEKKERYEFLDRLLALTEGNNKRELENTLLSIEGKGFQLYEFRKRHAKDTNGVWGMMHKMKRRFLNR